MGTRGRFITFEGLDGSGKSTQIEKLAGALRSLHVEVLLSREPGGTAIGESIRRLLLDSGTRGLDPRTEMALMFAARVQHLQELILPALEAGHYVLCDRFSDSTEAYQGGGRKLGSEIVLSAHRVLCANLQPDLTLFLDCDLTVSLERAQYRNRLTSAAGHADENRFEQESRAFFGRVHDKFWEIVAREPVRVVPVDARGTPAETHEKVLAVVRERFSLPTI